MQTRTFYTISFKKMHVLTQVFLHNCLLGCEYMYILVCKCIYIYKYIYIYIYIGMYVCVYVYV